MESPRLFHAEHLSVRLAYQNLFSHLPPSHRTAHRYRSKGDDHRLIAMLYSARWSTAPFAGSPR